MWGRLDFRPNVLSLQFPSIKWLSYLSRSYNWNYLHISFPFVGADVGKSNGQRDQTPVVLKMRMRSATCFLSFLNSFLSVSVSLFFFSFFSFSLLWYFWFFVSFLKILRCWSIGLFGQKHFELFSRPLSLLVENSLKVINSTLILVLEQLQ